jgi:diguanylate cyclase (GGDEF)-like protein
MAGSLSLYTIGFIGVIFYSSGFEVVPGIFAAGIVMLSFYIDLRRYKSSIKFEASDRQLRYISETAEAIRRNEKSSVIIEQIAGNLCKELKIKRALFYSCIYNNRQSVPLFPLAGVNVSLKTAANCCSICHDKNDPVMRSIIENKMFSIKKSADAGEYSRNISEILHFKSFITIPLTSGGRTCGLLIVETADGKNRLDLNTLMFFANQAAIVIEDMQFKKKIEDLNVYDELTGLSNKSGFLKNIENEMNRVERYFRSDKDKFSIILVEITEFPKYCSIIGREQTDIFLAEIGSIIKKMVRKVDSIARFGSGEFVVLLPSTTSDRAGLIAERITESVKEFDFKYKNMFEGITIPINTGIATYKDSGVSIDELFDSASNKLHSRNAEMARV